MSLISRYIILSLLVLMSTGCYDDNSKKDYEKTELLGDGIYCETYRVFGGGVYGGDVYSEYLTDSISFRYFVGSYDDNNNLTYTIKGSVIEIRHISYDKKDGAVIVDKIEKLSKEDVKHHPKSEKINRK